MISRFCSVIPDKKKGRNHLLKMIFASYDSKVKSRLVLKLRNMAQQSDAFGLNKLEAEKFISLFEEADEELKDSILELIYVSGPLALEGKI